MGRFPPHILEHFTRAPECRDLKIQAQSSPSESCAIQRRLHALTAHKLEQSRTMQSLKAAKQVRPQVTPFTYKVSCHRALAPPSRAALLSYKVHAKQRGYHHQPMYVPSFWRPWWASGTSGTGPAFLWAVERASCWVPAPRGSKSRAALPGRGAPTGAGGSSLEPEPRTSDTLALCPANVGILSGPAQTATLGNVPAHQSLPPSAQRPAPLGGVTMPTIPAAPPGSPNVLLHQGARAHRGTTLTMPRSPRDRNWHREPTPNLSSNADDD